jgi:D-alanine-D-alanine ligase
MKFDHDGPLQHNAGFVCPSMLTPLQRARIGRTCRAAYRALRCRGYARVDLRMRNDRLYVVDVNPNPDINSESLLVIAAGVVGLSYDEVIARITEFAVERWRAAHTAQTAARATARTTAGEKRSRKREQPEIVSQ